MVQKALLAAEALQREGVSAEVIDLRTLRPLDMNPVYESIHKTHRALVVEEDWTTGGMGAEIAARISDELFDELDAPVRRVAAQDVFCAYQPVLEDAILPQSGDIRRALPAELDGQIRPSDAGQPANRQADILTAAWIEYVSRTETPGQRSARLDRIDERGRWGHVVQVLHDHHGGRLGGVAGLVGRRHRGRCRRHRAPVSNRSSVGPFGSRANGRVRRAGRTRCGGYCRPVEPVRSGRRAGRAEKRALGLRRLRRGSGSRGRRSGHGDAGSGRQRRHPEGVAAGSEVRKLIETVRICGRRPFRAGGGTVQDHGGVGHWGAYIIAYDALDAAVALRLQLTERHAC